MKKENGGFLEISDSDEDELENTAETIPDYKHLSLKKKISLPQLIKRTTSFHERKYVERKSREGIHGVGKSVWNKYHEKEWEEEFYHYFEDMLDTFLRQKLKLKI